MVKEEWLERVVGVKGRRHDMERVARRYNLEVAAGVAGVEGVRDRTCQGRGERRGKK